MSIRIRESLFDYISSINDEYALTEQSKDAIIMFINALFWSNETNSLALGFAEGMEKFLASLQSGENKWELENIK